MTKGICLTPDEDPTAAKGQIIEIQPSVIGLAARSQAAFSSDPPPRVRVIFGDLLKMTSPELVSCAKIRRDDPCMIHGTKMMVRITPDHPFCPDLAEGRSKGPMDHPVDMSKGDQRSVH